MHIPKCNVAHRFVINGYVFIIIQTYLFSDINTQALHDFSRSYYKECL